jgi:hypothetical protein
LPAVSSVPGPTRLQVTAVFVDPVTDAENAVEFPRTTCDVPGVTETERVGAGLGVLGVLVVLELLPPEQLMMRPRAASAKPHGSNRVIADHLSW